MVWYFQASPHDTHDWDAAQTPVLIDGTVNGQPRKLLAQASRNGHFFLMDRATGKSIVSTEFVKTNWSLGYDERGQPIPNPAKMPQIDGALVSPNQGGAINWQSPSFSPATGLFYVNANRAFSVYYIYDPSDNPAGWGGTDRGGYSESMLQAIEYATGKIRWTHPWKSGGSTGILSTAGNVLFTGGSGGLEALNATTGARALALAHRHHHQRADHLRARRRAAHRRRLGEQRVRLRAEQIGFGPWALGFGRRC